MRKMTRVASALAVLLTFFAASCLAAPPGGGGPPMGGRPMSGGAMAKGAPAGGNMGGKTLPQGGASMSGGSMSGGGATSSGKTSSGAMAGGSAGGMSGVSGPGGGAAMTAGSASQQMPSGSGPAGGAALAGGSLSAAGTGAQGGAALSGGSMTSGGKMPSGGASMSGGAVGAGSASSGNMAGGSAGGGSGPTGGGAVTGGQMPSGSGPAGGAALSGGSMASAGAASSGAQSGAPVAGGSMSGAGSMSSGGTSMSGGAAGAGGEAQESSGGGAALDAQSGASLNKSAVQISENGTSWTNATGEYRETSEGTFWRNSSGEFWSSADGFGVRNSSGTFWTSADGARRRWMVNNVTYWADEEGTRWRTADNQTFWQKEDDILLWKNATGDYLRNDNGTFLRNSSGTYRLTDNGTFWRNGSGVYGQSDGWGLWSDGAGAYRWWDGSGAVASRNASGDYWTSTEGVRWRNESGRWERWQGGAWLEGQASEMDGYRGWWEWDLAWATTGGDGGWDVQWGEWGGGWGGGDWGAMGGGFGPAGFGGGVAGEGADGKGGAVARSDGAPAASGDPGASSPQSLPQTTIPTIGAASSAASADQSADGQATGPPPDPSQPSVTKSADPTPGVSVDASGVVRNASGTFWSTENGTAWSTAEGEFWRGDDGLYWRNSSGAYWQSLDNGTFWRNASGVFRSEGGGGWSFFADGASFGGFRLTDRVWESFATVLGTDGSSGEDPLDGESIGGEAADNMGDQGSDPAAIMVDDPEEPSALDEAALLSAGFAKATNDSGTFWTKDDVTLSQNASGVYWWSGGEVWWRNAEGFFWRSAGGQSVRRDESGFWRWAGASWETAPQDEYEVKFEEAEDQFEAFGLAGSQDSPQDPRAKRVNPSAAINEEALLEAGFAKTTNASGVFWSDGMTTLTWNASGFFAWKEGQAWWLDWTGAYWRGSDGFFWRSAAGTQKWEGGQWVLGEEAVSDNFAFLDGVWRRFSREPGIFENSEQETRLEPLEPLPYAEMVAGAEAEADVNGTYYEGPSGSGWLNGTGVYFRQPEGRLWWRNATGTFFRDTTGSYWRNGTAWYYWGGVEWLLSDGSQAQVHRNRLAEMDGVWRNALFPGEQTGDSLPQNTKPAMDRALPGFNKSVNASGTYYVGDDGVAWENASGLYWEASDGSLYWRNAEGNFWREPGQNGTTLLRNDTGLYRRDGGVWRSAESEAQDKFIDADAIWSSIDSSPEERLAPRLLSVPGFEAVSNASGTFYRGGEGTVLRDGDGSVFLRDGVGNTVWRNGSGSFWRGADGKGLLRKDTNGSVLWRGSEEGNWTAAEDFADRLRPAEQLWEKFDFASLDQASVGALPKATPEPAADFKATKNATGEFWVGEDGSTAWEEEGKLLWKGQDGYFWRNDSNIYFQDKNGNTFRKGGKGIYRQTQNGQWVDADEASDVNQLFYKVEETWDSLARLGRFGDSGAWKDWGYGEPRDEDDSLRMAGRYADKDSAVLIDLVQEGPAPPLPGNETVSGECSLCSGEVLRTWTACCVRQGDVLLCACAQGFRRPDPAADQPPSFACVQDGDASDAEAASTKNSDVSDRIFVVRAP